MMDWPNPKLSSILNFEYGSSLPSSKRDDDGNVPVMGSNGIIGKHSSSLVKGPGIIVGRKGSAGKIIWIELV